MSACSCDTVQDVRVTNEHFGGICDGGGFRPRCGQCGGKLHDYTLSDEIVKQLPDPSEISDDLVDVLGEMLLETDEDLEVSMTMTCERPERGGRNDRLVG